MAEVCRNGRLVRIWNPRLKMVKDFRICTLSQLGATCAYVSAPLTQSRHRVSSNFQRAFLSNVCKAVLASDGNPSDASSLVHSLSSVTRRSRKFDAVNELVVCGRKAGRIGLSCSLAVLELDSSKKFDRRRQYVSTISCVILRQSLGLRLLARVAVRCIAVIFSQSAKAVDRGLPSGIYRRYMLLQLARSLE